MVRKLGVQRSLALGSAYLSLQHWFWKLTCSFPYVPHCLRGKGSNSQPQCVLAASCLVFYFPFLGCFLIQPSSARPTQRFECLCPLRALLPAIPSVLVNDKVVVVDEQYQTNGFNIRFGCCAFYNIEQLNIIPLHTMERLLFQNDNPTMYIEDIGMGKLVYHREI